MTYKPSRTDLVLVRDQSSSVGLCTQSLQVSTGWLQNGVALFSIVASRHFDISKGSVATHLRCGGIFSDPDPVLLHVFSWFCEWNNFENRLIFDEVKAYQKTAFLGHPVHVDGYDLCHPG